MLAGCGFNMRKLKGPFRVSERPGILYDIGHTQCLQKLIDMEFLPKIPHNSLWIFCLLSEDRSTYLYIKI